MHTFDYVEEDTENNDVKDSIIDKILQANEVVVSEVSAKEDSDSEEDAKHASLWL